MTEIVQTGLYDECEIHRNCTVEVWRNSQTGETSVGWYDEEFRGRWELTNAEDWGEKYWQCSVCGCGESSYDCNYHTNYCPNCGAKMDADEDEEEKDD